MPDFYLHYGRIASDTLLEEDGDAPAYGDSGCWFSCSASLIICRRCSKIRC
jgi:hypothetical protein